jgi:hypothetical protein
MRRLRYRSRPRRRSLTRDPSDTQESRTTGGDGLGTVSCTSRANCVAATQYLADAGSSDYRAMVAVETAGAWGPAIQLQLPANANSTLGTQFVRVNSLACTSVGNCTVVADGYVHLAWPRPLLRRSGSRSTHKRRYSRVGKFGSAA